MLVAGRDRAAVAASALALRATHDGWPPLVGQVLVIWRACAAGRDVERAPVVAPPAATIVTPVGGCEFSQRLRAAGAQVTELVDPRVDPSEYPEQPFLPALTDSLRQVSDVTESQPRGERRGTG